MTIYYAIEGRITKPNNGTDFFYQHDPVAQQAITNFLSPYYVQAVSLPPEQGGKVSVWRAYFTNQTQRDNLLAIYNTSPCPEILERAAYEEQENIYRISYELGYIDVPE